MRFIEAFFNLILGGRLWRRPSRPEEIPRKMAGEALEKALQEARFLHARHVDVRDAEPGEIPLPRRADKEH